MPMMPRAKLLLASRQYSSRPNPNYMPKLEKPARDPTENLVSTNNTTLLAYGV